MIQRSRSRRKQAPVSARELSDARFKRFLRDMRAYERKQRYERTLDAFLNIYSTWLRTHEPSLKMRLVLLAFELRRLDSSFSCDLAFTE